MKKLLVAALMSLSAAMVAPVFAASDAIDAAKAECIIGERNDGYLGVVDGKTASDALRREMASINQRRKAAYANLAADEGVSIETTAALTAESLINNAPSGECVQNANGDWVRVP